MITKKKKTMTLLLLIDKKTRKSTENPSPHPPNLMKQTHIPSPSFDLLEQETPHTHQVAEESLL
jgi:hypothetical protein